MRNLRASVSEDGRVRLTWLPPLPDGGGEVTRYYVIRFSLTGGKESWSFTRFLPGHVRSYEDTPMDEGPHRYYVGALSAHGSGRRTSVDVEVHATTAALSTGLR